MSDFINGMEEIQHERHTQQLALLAKCSLTREDCEIELAQLRARREGLEASAVYTMGDDWGGLEHDFLSDMIGTLERKMENAP
jgi:hypothetical protein